MNETSNLDQARAMETDGGINGVVTLPGRGDIRMDRVFLAELDQQTTEALLASARRQLPYIIDANLSPAQSGLLAEFPSVLQIHIDADHKELRRRCDARRRHPVHVAKADVSIAGISRLARAHEAWQSRGGSGSNARQ